MSKNLKQVNSSRLEWLDSVKGIMIFLVVFGHFIGAKCTNEINLFSVTHYFIYAVHMPIFIFISGFLSKRKSKIEKIVKNLIIPYIIFDLLYVAVSNLIGGHESFNILFPTYVYWYILCIALMRLSVEFLDKTKIAFFMPVISIAFCYFCSENIWRFLSIGRVFLLFPVFYLGYKLDGKKIEFFRNKKWVSIIIGICATVIEILALKFNIIGILDSTHNYPENISDSILKYLFMIISVGIFIFTASLVPAKIKFLKRWGENSLMIYLIHPYAILFFGKIFNKLNIQSDTLYFVILFIISVLVTEILSLEIIKNVYQKLIEYINKIFDALKNKIIKK